MQWLRTILFLIGIALFLEIVRSERRCANLDTHESAPGQHSDCDQIALKDFFPCSLTSGETKLAYPENCTKYYVCVDGSLRSQMECARGTWFDRQTQECVLPQYSDSDCELEMITLPTTVTTPDLPPKRSISDRCDDDERFTILFNTEAELNVSGSSLPNATYYTEFGPLISDLIPIDLVIDGGIGFWLFNSSVDPFVLIDLRNMEGIVKEVGFRYYCPDPTSWDLTDFVGDSEEPSDPVRLPQSPLGNWSEFSFSINRDTVSNDPIQFAIFFEDMLGKEGIFLLDYVNYTSTRPGPSTEATSTPELTTTPETPSTTNLKITTPETVPPSPPSTTPTIETGITFETTGVSPKTTTYRPPFIACQGEDSVKCSGRDKTGTLWEGCAGDVVPHDCPGTNASGVATWECLPSGNFNGPNPDFSKCFMIWVAELEAFVDREESIHSSTANEILTLIHDKCNASIVSNGTVTAYYGHEIKRIFKVGSKTIKLVDPATETHLFEKLAYKAVWIMGMVFAYPNPWEELNSFNCSSTGSMFISAIEKSALEISLRVSRNSSFAEMGKYRKAYAYVDHFDMGCGAQVRSETENETIHYPFKYSEDKDSFIQLPSDWANYISDKDVKFVGMQMESTFVNQLFPGNLSLSNEMKSPDKIVNSNMLSFSFDTASVKRSGLNFTANNGVRIKFRHDVEAWGADKREIRRKLQADERPKAVLGSSACVFWNPEDLVWSSEGCKLVESKRALTICECFHLTSFALLMDVHKYVGKQLALEVLTWILSPLSIIGLAICIFVFSTSIKSVRSPRHEITNHLCIWLLVGNILLLLFMDRNYFHLGDGMCMTIGILVHYSFLVAFMWTSVEGFQLYQMVIVVFDDGKDYIVIQRILAYGLPALIVGITAGVGAGKSEPAYGGDAFCWLEEDYIWAFMGPLALVILSNLALLVLCLRKAYSLNSNPKMISQISRKEKSFISWVKGTFSLSVLLGVTWIFGYLMLSPLVGLSNFAAYLFTILNSSQGIFLFIFHCWMNQNARESLKRRFPKWLPLSNKRSLKTGSTGTSTSFF